MTRTVNLGSTAQRGLPASRARLVSGRLALALVSSFGALTSFYLLLSVMPMYAVSAGAGSAGVAAPGLFAQAVTATASRCRAGRHGDRHGHAAVLIPGLAIAAAGMITLIWVAVPAVVIGGMCLFGIGFGIAQNATFALMIERAPACGYGTASALWNLAYGAGAAVFGVFVAHTGYPAAFALTGLLILAALRPALRGRGAARPGAACARMPPGSQFAPHKLQRHELGIHINMARCWGSAEKQPVGPGDGAARPASLLPPPLCPLHPARNSINAPSMPP